MVLGYLLDILNLQEQKNLIHSDILAQAPRPYILDP
nr:MAG TPA: hypothetical protein [Caudoviricetes sp.]